MLNNVNFTIVINARIPKKRALFQDKGTLVLIPNDSGSICKIKYSMIVLLNCFSVADTLHKDPE